MSKKEAINYPFNKNRFRSHAGNDIRLFRKIIKLIIKESDKQNHNSEYKSPSLMII